MNKRLIIILTVFLTLVIIILVGYKFAKQKPEVTPPSFIPGQGTVIEEDLDVPPLQTDALETEIPPSDPVTDAISQTARVFVEQWGSYSATDPEDHLMQSKVFVSDEYKSTINQNIEEGVLRIVTTSRTVKIKEKSSDSAILEVITERQVDKGFGLEDSYRQRAVVTLINQDGVWLISNANWSKDKF